MSIFSIHLKSRNGGIDIGQNQTVKVNCNIGANNLTQYKQEIARLNVIKKSGIIPDSFMDLSLCSFNKPLYSYIDEIFEAPVGVVPTYQLKEYKEVKALDLLKKYADDGIAFMTLHLTASVELYKKSQKRKIPITSRGGSMLLQHMLYDDVNNIWIELLPQIINLAKQYKFAISLGSTFRPAGIKDACDEVHYLETLEQLKLCHELQREGIQVMVENVGHIDLKNLEVHCSLLKNFNAPIMPLGPIPTDCAVGMDHIATAIGASFMGYKECAHIINCVTASEHTSSFPSILETIEAIKVAKLTAHIIDITKGYTKEDEEIYLSRASASSCLVSKNKSCNRCDNVCPLKMKI